MLEPVKVAFARFMRRYFDSLTATTKPMEPYVKKDFSTAVFMANTRMVDAAEDMLSKYMRLDWGHEHDPHWLPVVMFALARDYTPTGRDYTRQVADGEYVTFPDDEKQRAFRVRVAAGDVRAQVVFFASDEPTARSLAAQFLLFLDQTDARRFWADYTFAGFVSSWPVQVESPDSPAMNIQTESKNLCILAVDLTLKCSIPFFSAPRVGEATDGKGVDGGAEDPSGYPVVVSICTPRCRRIEQE